MEGRGAAEAVAWPSESLLGGGVGEGGLPGVPETQTGMRIPKTGGVGGWGGVQGGLLCFCCFLLGCSANVR